MISNWCPAKPQKGREDDKNEGNAHTGAMGYQDPYSPIWVIGPEPKSRLLAKVHEGFCNELTTPREILEADARLIAAAPDLLLACEKAKQFL